MISLENEIKQGTWNSWGEKGRLDGNKSYDVPELKFNM